MKKLVSVSLFIFFAAVTSLFAAGLVFYQNSKPGFPATAPVSPVSPGSATGDITLDSAEISKHNSVNDCWLVINSKVYNVTSYLGFHPGGVGSIASYCGREATQAFDTKDIGRPHSASANALLSEYYIGDLGQKVGQQQIQQNVQNTSQATPPAGTRRGRGEEIDD